MPDPRRQLLTIFAHALEGVRGDHVVAEGLREIPDEGRWEIVAIGKAAAAMWRGAREALGERRGASLVITKHGHAEGLASGPDLEVMESDHPVPGPCSLEAGRRLLTFLDDAPADARFLFLISGGASSLVEVLPEGMTLERLARLNTWLLGSGLEISLMNAVRKRASRIKGGGLLRWLKGRPARCLLISDVPGDDPAVIGSGLLVPSDIPLPSALPQWVRDCLEELPRERAGVDCRVVASREHLLDAAERSAAEAGFTIHRHETFLEGDAAQTGRETARALLDAPAGLHLWAGETTVRLPENPGRGGRNQQFALAAAMELEGHSGIYLLAAGTDGTDGPTEDAGALVDGRSVTRMRIDGIDAGQALARADAGTALEVAGDLIRTGPTGTNVMDLVIALKLDTTA